jgi:hypothetical protein
MDHIVIIYILIGIIFYILLNRDIKEHASNLSNADIEAIGNLSSMYNNGTLKMTNLELTGYIKAKSGTFGPAYIGQYGNNEDNAMFSHVNNKSGGGNYAVVQHKNGNTYINSKKDKHVHINNDNFLICKVSKNLVNANVDVKTSENFRTDKDLFAHNAIHAGKDLYARNAVHAGFGLYAYGLNTSEEMQKQSGKLYFNYTNKPQNEITNKMTAKIGNNTEKIKSLWKLTNKNFGGTVLSYLPNENQTLGFSRTNQQPLLQTINNGGRQGGNKMYNLYTFSGDYGNNGNHGVYDIFNKVNARGYIKY